LTAFGQEMDRVLSLPRRQPWAGRELPPRTAALADRLLPVQIEVLADLESSVPPVGVLGDIGAGYGKTIPSLLAPHVLGLVTKDSILILPPDLVRKTEMEVNQWSGTFPELVGTAPQLLSAAILSHRRHADVLFEMTPKLIVLDEAHIFCDPTSARTRRLLKYVREYPETRFLVLSGTLTHKELLKLSHLAELALRDGSFLPIDDAVLEAWSTVLDYRVQPAESDKLQLHCLLEWAGLTPRKTSIFAKDAGSRSPLAVYREAYKQRRSTAPNVVCTPDATVGASLNLREWTTDLPESVKWALQTLRADWELPDGEEIVDFLEFHRHAMTLAWGFYYRTNYSGPDLERWKEARRGWSRAIRSQLLYIPGWTHLDSPAQVAEAAASNSAHPSVNRAWKAWATIRNSIQSEQETIWVDTEHQIIQSAVKTLRESGRGIFWYRSRAVESVLRQYLPTFGAGSDQPSDDENLVACSIFAHGTGKNLHAWDYQLIGEYPSGHRNWEQLLARCHRHGQQSDAVWADIATHTKELQKALRDAREAARYAEEVGAQRQRLVYANTITQ